MCTQIQKQAELSIKINDDLFSQATPSRPVPLFVPVAVSAISGFRETTHGRLSQNDVKKVMVQHSSSKEIAIIAIESLWDN